MYYLDSSVAVKIYVHEQGSGWMRKLRRRSAQGELFVSELSGAEVFAAFHRRARSDRSLEGELKNICQRFAEDFEKFHNRLPARKNIVDMAMQLIQKHPLRGYDSIQLATAIRLLDGLQGLDGEWLRFVSADKGLNEAARSEGLTVIDPSELD